MVYSNRRPFYFGRIIHFLIYSSTSHWLWFCLKCFFFFLQVPKWFSHTPVLDFGSIRFQSFRFRLAYIVLFNRATHIYELTNRWRTVFDNCLNQRFNWLLSFIISFGCFSKISCLSFTTRPSTRQAVKLDSIRPDCRPVTALLLGRTNRMSLSHTYYVSMPHLDALSTSRYGALCRSVCQICMWLTILYCTSKTRVIVYWTLRATRTHNARIYNHNIRVRI